MINLQNPKALKHFGQNFLQDTSIISSIIDVAGKIEGEKILEIGPGIGAITIPILEARPESLISVEIDQRLIDFLSDKITGYPNFKLWHKDALKLDLQEVASVEKPVKIIANLPYNIATALLLKWLEQKELVKDITVMVQKEVAERIYAAPNSKSYGSLSILMQLDFDVLPCLEVPPEAFHPVPKVNSAVIKLVPKEINLEPKVKTKLAKICQVIFSQRRKTLRNSLKQLTSQPEEVLAESGVDGNLRPENINIDGYIAIAKHL